jgi:hypothetical protein
MTSIKFVEPEAPVGSPDRYKFKSETKSKTNVDGTGRKIRRYEFYGSVAVSTNGLLGRRIISCRPFPAGTIG